MSDRPATSHWPPRWTDEAIVEPHNSYALSKRDQEDIDPGLYRVGDTRLIFPDVTKLEALGWSTQVPMNEIISEYVTWATEQPDLQDTFAVAQKRMEASGVLRLTCT